MSNCVETSEDVWGLVTVSNTPLILRLSLAWPDDAFLTIFQVCFPPIVSCISHTLQWYISQMTPNRVCPSGTSASVSDLLCLMMCFYKQQYFSLTHEQYFSKLTCSNALILCPLFWRDYVWWCLQPLPSEKACAWFTTFGCVTVTDQNITPETSDEEQGYICQNVNMPYICQCQCLT